MKQKTTSVSSMSKKTLGMVQIALFSAIIIVMAFTPFFGYIPLGFTRATIIHIPVIIGSLILGPVQGAILGGIFGLTSLINNTINPTATSFVFSPFYSGGIAQGGWQSIVICFLPRILTGVIPFYVYYALKGKGSCSKKRQSFALSIAGFAGSMTNTLLVMNFIYIFFGQSYAIATKRALNSLYSAILVIIGFNGIPEAIVAAIIVTAVVRALMHSKSVQKSVQHTH